MVSESLIYLEFIDSKVILREFLSTMYLLYRAKRSFILKFSCGMETSLYHFMCPRLIAIDVIGAALHIREENATVVNN